LLNHNLPVPDRLLTRVFTPPVKADANVTFAMNLPPKWSIIHKLNGVEFSLRSLRPALILWFLSLKKCGIARINGNSSAKTQFKDQVRAFIP
jgi:hypothetical protein